MLSEQLRQAIDASGRSRYRICMEIGLDQAVMSKFMSGKGGLAMDTVDRIGDLLGLRLVANEGRGRTGGDDGKGR